MEIPHADRPPAQPGWEQKGTVVLPDVCHADVVRALGIEAREQLETATPYSREEVSSRRDGSLASPVHCAFLPATDRLEKLAFDKDLLHELRKATGLWRLVPRGAVVVVYRRGDFQGLHTDTVKATVTAAVALSDNLPPMGWAPTLRDAFPDEQAKLIAERGIFPEGEEFEQLAHPHDGGVRAFAGYSIPHWRTPFPDELGLLATFSYMDL
ncbi:hypothetical protein [Streptomyces synnematoformans]|uniref:2OG-Fe(II) oxygenase n=1 Tax=Streptomyces synnematoformans TaxID=415721 RepID=A0ABN2XHH4_9ACTN